MKTLTLTLLILFSFSSTAQLYSFSKSKRVLAQLYKGKQETSFYCGCDFSYQGKKLIPDLNSCGYGIRKQIKRSNRIEWEHIVPAWNFGHQRQCWKDGGRRACKKDPSFKIMEGDMHNLVPAIGEVNGDRSNYRFTDWNGKPNQYGQCQVIVDFKRKQVQPPMLSRGPIARAYLYMASQYRLKLSKRDQQQYDVWNKQFPPLDWECHRNLLIESRQGNGNPFIKGCADIHLKI
jgi:deoxyribonuclease-1